MMGFFISRPEGRVFPYSKQTGTEIAWHYPQPPSISTLTPAYQHQPTSLYGEVMNGQLAYMLLKDSDLKCTLQ